MCDYCVVYFFYSVCNTDASDACAINSLFYKIVIVEHYLYNFAFIFVSMIVFPLNLMKRVEIPSALWAAALVAMPSIPRKIMMSRLCRDATQLISGLWLIALQFQEPTSLYELSWPNKLVKQRKIMSVIKRLGLDKHSITNRSRISTYNGY